MKTKKYTKDGITFKSVKIPLTLFKEGPIGITPTYLGQNAEGNKGIHYDGNTIDSVVPFINAVDIDWNEAVVNGTPIKTSGQLLKKISELSDALVGSAKSAFLLWQEEDLEGRADATISDFLNYLKGETGKSAYQSYRDIVEGNGGTPLTEENWIDSLKGDKGDPGEDGQNGITPNFSIGTVSPGAADTLPSVTLSGTQTNPVLNFVIPRGKDGTSSGGSGTGETNIINSISVNGIDIPPNSNRNVNIDLSDYATTEALQLGLATKLDVLISTQNIRLIKYSNSPGLNKDWKYISLLPKDGSTSISTDPTFNPYDTSPYSSEGTINMAKVAFTGRYNDLINRPDDDKYIKIFRKSLREEATTYYPDKDSILRVVYKCVSKGQKSVIAGEQYGIENYTEEEILHHNQSLPGAILGGTILSENPIPDPIHPEDSNYNTPSALMVNTKIGTHYNVGDTISALDANSYNAELLNAWDETTPKEGTSPRTNIHDENVFIQNQVLGDHAVALSWGGIIGSSSSSSLLNGNYGFTEGKGTKVYGDFSRSSGYQTETHGDYSSSGGLNLNNGDIKGNYSLGYGKDIVTNNNGEVAFGEYNKSTTILNLQRPVANTIALDTKNNTWKIIDFYNVVLSDFTSNIDLEFGDYYDGCEHYNYGYEALSFDGYNVVYDNNYNFNYVGNDNISGNYTTFIKHIFDVNCNILNNDTDIYNFLIGIIYTLNRHKSIYTYNYESIGHSLGGIEPSGSIVGVIALKCDELGNPIQKLNEYDEPLIDGNNNPIYEYEFFVWGPESLYYEHTPITKFSIGNGNSEENRNNLIEVTDDGNIHYAKGEKSLFTLENVVENILNNLDLSVDEVSNFNSSISLNNNDLIFDISNLTPSRILINNSNFSLKGDTNNRHIVFNISLGEYDYYLKVILLDTSCLGSGTNAFIKFNSLDCNIYTNGILDYLIDLNNGAYDLSTDSVNNYEITDLSDKMLKISIEVFLNNCLVNIEEYNKSIIE